MPQNRSLTTAAAGEHPPGSQQSASRAEPIPAVHRWQCSGCDRWYPLGTRCRVCLACARCETVVRRDRTVLTSDRAEVCSSCLDACYWQCPECARWSRRGEVCATGCCDPVGCECEDCRVDADVDVDVIRGYSYRPLPVFRGTGPLFLGPEIEVETPALRLYECAQLADAHLRDLGYLKEDGSLNDGFEIVTHPMSYEWAIANFPWQMLTELADAGCYTGDNTGLHVHLSRAGFRSPCHTYRWMKFIYRNQQHVTRLAQRTSGQWAAFTDDDRRSAVFYAKGGRSDERYRAINTGNVDTFELRVFASSLDPCHVQAVFGFAAASVEYTRTLTAKDIVSRSGWDWITFVQWLRQQRIYQPLLDRLEVL